MIKLVIFDLDGTLVDSVQDILDSANIVIAEHGFKPMGLDEIQKHIGDGLRPLVRGLIGEERSGDSEFVEKLAQKFLDVYDGRLLNNTKFYDGAQDFLNWVWTSETWPLQDASRRIGIATNKPEGQARIILDGLGTPTSRYVEVFGGDTFEVKKPDPKPLNELMRLAGVAPGETLMVGDSRQDAFAAKNAGTHFVGVTFGYNSVEKLRSVGATQFISHFSELKNFI